MEDVREILRDLAKRWNELEARLKVAEQFRQEAVVPAINEMRYAGRRMADIFAQGTENGWVATDGVKADLSVAWSYLQNAEHDIVDGICFYAHKRIRKTLEVHGQAKVFKSCPEVERLYPAMIAAEETVRQSRETRKERAKKYSELAADYLPKVMRAVEALQSDPKLRIGDDLPERLGLLDRHVKVVGWISLFGSVASLIGGILAVWALVLAYNPPERGEQSQESEAIEAQVE